jgi:hypothetical protein
MQRGQARWGLGVLPRAVVHIHDITGLIVILGLAFRIVLALALEFGVRRRIIAPLAAQLQGISCEEMLDKGASECSSGLA